MSAVGAAWLLAATAVVGAAALVTVVLRRLRRAERRLAELVRDSIQDHVAARRRVADELGGAVERGELMLHYQPVIDLATGRLTAVEALVRWRHPERGLVPPAEFVPVAEETGVIGRLGAFVLDEACRQLRDWRDGHPGAAAVRVAVNAAPPQLADPTFPDTMRAVLEAYHLAPGDVCLEVTESALAGDLVAVTRELSDLGVELAIDDFGTGFSSLSRLRMLPFGTLKIDRSFVAPSCEAVGRHVLASIVGMAQGLGIRVTAEGVETAEQLLVVRELGCDDAQGFFFARPVAPDVIAPLLDAPDEAFPPATIDLRAPRIALETDRSRFSTR